MNSPKLFAVLPVYNEGANLKILVDELDSQFRTMGLSYEIIAVDDGSDDESAAILAECSTRLPLTVITHRRNRGLGETIRDGFELAADSAGDDDVIVRLDADRTHSPEYLPALLQAIESGADIAIASRFADGGGQEGVPGDRSWISSLANILFKLFFPIRGLQEYTCGYRAYRAELLKQAFAAYGDAFIQLRGFGFCCTVEKLVKLHVLGAQIVEVPFVLRYDLKQSSSKLVFNLTTFGYAAMVIMHHWPWGGWRTSPHRDTYR